MQQTERKPIFSIWQSNSFQVAQNKYYPNRRDIYSLRDLIEASRLDNVGGEFLNNERGTDRLIFSNVAFMDLDNGHSDNPKYHKTIEDLKAAFPGVNMYYLYSRNHNKDKVKDNGEIEKGRYKIHVFFPLTNNYTISTRQALKEIKLAAGGMFPYFDTQAADIARFFFGIDRAGSEEEHGGVVDGYLNLDDYLIALGRDGLKEAILSACDQYEQSAAEELGENWKESKDYWYSTQGKGNWRDKTAFVTGQGVIRGTDRGVIEEYSNDNIMPASGVYEGDTNEQQRSLADYFEKFAKRHGIHYERKTQGVFIYYFVTCPWEQLHTTRGKYDSRIAIIPFKDGSARLQYKCYHDHCKSRTWEDYKNYYLEIERKEEEKRRPDQLSSFLDRIQSEAYRPYKTGLTFFDDLLGGGVIPQSLILLMAAPGTGKTTLCQQIAERIAESKKKVIYLNLEMSSEQMLAKAISCRLSKSDDAKKHRTMSQILQGYDWTETDRELINAAIDEYRNTAAQFIKYNPAGVGSDLEKILKYLRLEGELATAAGEPAPVVVVDYLHLISTNTGLDVKELIKQAVTGLKDYAKRFNTIVIGIVAINRQSGGRIALDSARDSSNIEYTGDYILSLEYEDIDNKKVAYNDQEEISKLQRKGLRDMIIRTLKSRFSAPGGRAFVKFDAANNVFYGEGDFIPGKGSAPFEHTTTKRKIL